MVRLLDLKCGIGQQQMPWAMIIGKDPFGTYSWQANFKGPGNWKPTEPGPDKPMGAVYCKVRTFAITETDKICLPPSAYYMQYSEDPKSEYYSPGLQVYTKNAASSYLVEWIGNTGATIY
ncbi:MAG: hypothetical protein IPM92_16650 [Saprospiraceae bacterium]|nr:hypothetical protein [Saprospiraceae bacterium]